VSQITATFVLNIPAGAKVGDEFTITGRARLTQIREDTVDVSTIDREQYMSGEMTYEMRVYEVRPHGR
jgi:hypothetical protein